MSDNQTMQRNLAIIKGNKRRIGPLAFNSKSRNSTVDNMFNTYEDPINSKFEKSSS